MRGAQVVAEALRWVGTPYHHQASRIGVGCDCLGLLRGVWRAVEGEEPERVPAYTADWGEADASEPLLSAGLRHLVPSQGEEAGEVLVFRMKARGPAKHCGIRCNADRFIHAVEGRGVVVEALTPAWRRRVAARLRFPGD